MLSAEQPDLKAGALFKTLVWPNAQRTLINTMVWCVCLAVYMRAMETLGVAEPQNRYGLGMYLTSNVIGGLISWVVTMTGWYAVARSVWAASPAARARYTLDGMYALLPWRILVPLLLALTLAGGTLTFASWTVYMDVTGSWTPTLRRQANLGSSLTVTFFSSFVLYFIDYFRVRATMQRIRAETAHRLSVEAQLQRLQAQMEPHMLFNTLANLHALIETSPHKAQDMLAHLIDYLRATLSASRTGSLPLRDEMARVQDYLALMQIRMGDRLRVQLDIPDELAGLHVPPMLIQPLVENAIKHGLDPVPAGGALAIRARVVGHALEIVVQDSGQGLHTSTTVSKQGGFGLSCIRARLQASYGDAARFTLDAAPVQTGTVATLSLPQTMTGAVHFSAPAP